MEEKKERTQKALMIVLLTLVVLITLLAAVLIIDSRHVKFIITGSEHMQIEAGETFTEPGVRVVTNGRLFSQGEEDFPVVTEGSVDTARVGEYKLRYKTNYLFHTFSAERTVEVVDTTPPQITLKHKAGYEPLWMDGYEEEGYTAKDIVDGDVTAKVETELGDGVVIYTVTDSHGNKATASRELPGLAVPVIALNNGENVSAKASVYYREPGFTATDGLGNDITSLVSVSGEVVPYTPGEYDRIYTIVNSKGESVSVTRHITIVPVSNPVTVMPDQKTIYLTFDDGPGPYTSQLLDILAKYEVKATFFVTASYPKYQDMIGRAYREGHSVGVHSYTHDYYTIYSGEKAYLDDFNAMEDIIYDQTGSYTTLFRFPGGSSNTVSSFNPGIMSRLTSTMEGMGYVYFDWNVSSGDAGETKDTKQVIENVIDGVSGKRAAVVLQHDIKDFSVNAVEKIILWGLNNGYAFRSLDESSYTAHHGVNN